MGKNKKKGGTKKRAAAAELTQEEAREELLALEAIFGDDLSPAQDGRGLGFALRVLPHPGEAAANYVSLTLVVSFPDDYPSAELGLRLTEAEGLPEAAVRQLSKALHGAAAEYAAAGEVCCFQLITLAQEVLQQHNSPPDEECGEPAAPESLWHEMLLRDRDRAAAEMAREHSFRAPVMGDAFFSDGGGLFSDAADLPVMGGAAGAVAAAGGAGVPVVEVRSKAARPHKPPPAAPQAAAAAAAAAAAPRPPVPRTASDARSRPAGGAAAAAAAAVEEVDSLSEEKEAAAAGAQAGAAPSAARLGSRTSWPGSSGGAAGRPSMQQDGGSMMRSLGQSIRGVLPRPLRRFLDGGASGTPEGSEAGDAHSTIADEDRALMRQELFLGHLLTLAASSGAVPPHALPSIAATLQAEGLIPKWLAFTLTQQPALFDRAFQRCFAKELEEAEQADEEDEDPMAWAVQRFWRRRAAPLLHSRSLGHLRGRGGGGGVGQWSPAEERLPASRYESDFAELRQLGRGGYGVVVAAINRLDGRQYAVKKIPLDAHSAGAYARIMREVTTLSRLQHVNVVRYFQAWVEATTAARDGSDDEGDSELDEWGSGSLLSSPRGPLSPTAARHGGGRAASAPLAVAPGGRPSGPLAPVAEVSVEGRASTPSGGMLHLPAAPSSDGEDSSYSGSDSGSSSSGSDSDPSSSEASEASGGDDDAASFDGNLAVAGANALLHTHGSGSDLFSSRPPSSQTAGFVSAWGGSGELSQSQSGTLSGSASGQPGRLGANGSGLTGIGSTDFSFDRARSQPAGGGSGAWGASGTQPGSSATQPSGTRSGGARGAVQQQLLLIQMEFCPRTLRDVLDSGELDDERRWSILRQILAGLAHIHAQGIIHRDLKPANTFIDSQGAVKLGDFGLAKYNTADGSDGELVSPAAAAAGGDSRHGMMAGGGSALLSDTTGLVGTSYYISPEIREGWASYDARVDLFSLGVMAFEIWHPFSTAMERAVLLRDLRERGVMPVAFEAAHPDPARLIKWLLAPNPAERPTAVEVLRSELLPPQVLDEQLTDLLRCLPDNPGMHEKVLEAVWALPRGAAPPSAAPSAALDAPGAPVAVQMAARDHVIAVLRDSFQRHGAVPMCSQDVGMAAADDPPGAVQLLTHAGTKLALRWELRAPFVAWFMQQLAGPSAAAGGAHAGSLLLDGLRRYEVAAVQRHAAGQGLPRSFLQADLDFVLPGERTAAELLLGDAEVITATHEALAELPECGDVEVRLGHRALFELALEYVGVSREARGSVIQLLSTAAGASPLHATARAKRWPPIKAGLEGIGLSTEAIGRCKQLVLQAAGEAESALYRLRTLLAHTAQVGRHSSSRRSFGGRPASGAALACLDDLAQLLQYLQAWGLPQGCLLVDPLLAPHSDAFSGALFQCHLVQGSTGTTAVVAAGGRYDSLLRAVWAQQSALSGTVAAMPPLHAVGVTLNVDRLVHVAQASSRWRQAANVPAVAGLPRLSQADVLVCSRGGGGLLKERMALARSLWDAGLSAELLPQAAPSLTEQYEYAQSRGIPWLVIIHASTFGAADTVRVKAMGGRTEEDVSVPDLPAYLLSALHPHGSAPPPGARTPAAMRSGDDGDVAGEQDDTSAHGGRERERQRRGGRR